MLQLQNVRHAIELLDADEAENSVHPARLLNDFKTPNLK